jgi:hypothetical protein
MQLPARRVRPFRLSRALVFAAFASASVACESGNGAPDRSEEQNLEATHEKVHHYMYVGRSDEQLDDANFLATSQFEGAQVAYIWKNLERSEGDYDFDAIEEHLSKLTAHAKSLFVYVKDTGSVESVGLPTYLLHDPKYGGGFEIQTSDDGSSSSSVARRWDPEVAKRFHALLQALGDRFDGRIAGVRLGETAIDIKTSGPHVPKGFTPEGYVDAVKANMLALKQAFPRSITIQHANFMPGEHEDDSLLREIYRYGISIGVGLAESDLMPSARHHYAYGIMQEREIKGHALIGIVAEDGNYIGKTGTEEQPPPGWPNLVPSMFDFAKQRLNATHVFWQNQDPFFAHDVVPFVRQQPVPSRN